MGQPRASWFKHTQSMKHQRRTPQTLLQRARRRAFGGGLGTTHPDRGGPGSGREDGLPKRPDRSAPEDQIPCTKLRNRHGIRAKIRGSRRPRLYRFRCTAGRGGGTDGRPQGCPPPGAGEFLNPPKMEEMLRLHRLAVRVMVHQALLEREPLILRSGNRRAGATPASLSLSPRLSPEPPCGPRSLARPGEPLGPPPRRPLKSRWRGH